MKDTQTRQLRVRKGMNPFLCGFLFFFLPLGELNITPKNEEHEKDLFTHFRHLIYFSGTGSTYIETDDL